MSKVVCDVAVRTGEASLRPEKSKIIHVHFLRNFMD